MHIQQILQEQLHDGKSWEDIEKYLDETLGIKLQHDDKFVGLNYCQINSPKSHPAVMECRALTLDKHTLTPVSRAYDRFFNWGEMPEFYEDFDVSNSVVMEKCDGSLIRVWWNCYADRWEIGTRSMYYGEGDHQTGISFRSLALEFIGMDEKEFQICFNQVAEKQKTYIFEMIGPRNRIVTRYKNEEWVLTGIRDNITGKYDTMFKMKSTVEAIKQFSNKVRIVETISLNSFEKIVEAAKNLSDLQEGFVAWCQKTNKRIKMKSPVYVSVHGIRENGQLSRKRALTLVLMNEQEEYLSYFEEDRPFFDPLVSEVEAFMKSISDKWQEVKHIENQKDFAMLVKDHPASGILFAAKKQQKDPLHVFAETDTNKKLRFFGF